MIRLSVNVVLVSIVLLLSIYPQDQSRGNDQVAVNAAPVDVVLENEILNATVQISVVAITPIHGLYDPVQDQPDGSNKPEGNIPTELTRQDSLGTLVSTGEERLIVTHNHWGGLIEAMSFVHFYNKNGEFLLAMNGDEFRNLIRYQDKGTLVIKAPEALNPIPQTILGEANLNQKTHSNVPENAGMPQEGDLVTFVHPKIGEEDQFEVLQASVKSTGKFKGLPIIKVFILNGIILPGNSGGGVWFNGHFIGNVWAIEEKTEFNWHSFQFEDSLTKLSYVAPFDPGMAK